MAKNIYVVKKSDLIGQISDFPIEVVQKMVERQYAQNGFCDASVFQRFKSAGDEGFAEQVLPTRAGFFFGGTDYDEWYYNKVQSCYEQMKIILDEWQDGDAIVIWFSW